VTKGDQGYTNQGLGQDLPMITVEDGVRSLAGIAQHRSRCKRVEERLSMVTREDEDLRARGP
jgi:hypothetical protein